VVEGTSLENWRTATFREFESHRTRQESAVENKTPLNQRRFVWLGQR
jgi:hypothetical protein